MVRQLFRLVAALALAGGALLTVSGPACACSCMPNPDMSERVAKADLVFTGRAVDTKVDGQTKVITFEVDTTYKGPAETKQEILTARDSAGCGLEVQENGEYLVFGSKSDHGMELKPAEGQYTSILCGGADPVTKAGLDDLSAVDGVQPTQVIVEKAPPAKPVTTGATESKPQATPEQAATGTPIWPWAAGAVVLLAAAGGVVWRRRARA
jgi:hypothetical protein